MRRLKLTWFPASILLGLVLCWYMLHLIQNTPGRDPLHDQTLESAMVFEGGPDLRIIVLTCNRPKLLQHLLESLAFADYLGDKVALDIWVDRLQDGSIHNDTVKAAFGFKFNRGEKVVYVRSKHVGTLKQWLYSWDHKANPDEIVVIFDDNVIVSAYFYRWLKTVHNIFNTDKRVSGFTLQGAGRISSGMATYKNISVSENHLTYLYPIPGTSGFSPNRVQWMKFMKWYENVSLIKDFNPVVPNDISGDLYREDKQIGRKENWFIWFINFNLINMKYVLYPNIQPNYQGFSIHMMEQEQNRKKYVLKMSEDSLIKQWSVKFESISRISPVVLVNGTVLQTDS